MHHARLIGITQPVRALDGEHPDTDRALGPSTPAELLAYCARVSNAANQGNHATGWKLLRSLIRRKEWSPLDMVTMTIEVETTRDVSRQMLRHWSFRFQEFSQRYAQVLELILRAARDKHPTDRQMSVNTANGGLADWWMRTQVAIRETVAQAYETAVNAGIALEVARIVLPEGMTPTKLYVQGSVRSFWHYCELRTQLSTQFEHRLVALDIQTILFEQFPDLATVHARPDPLREALEAVRTRFFPSDQPAHDRDELWVVVNEALDEV